jgi:hypothetical protein
LDWIGLDWIEEASCLGHEELPLPGTGSAARGSATDKTNGAFGA